MYLRARCQVRLQLHQESLRALFWDQFLIYINDFPEYLQNSTLRLFADDSIIYKEIKTINDAHNLQLDLDAACR